MPDIPPRLFMRARLQHEVEMGGEGFELSMDNQDDLRVLATEVEVGEYKLVAMHKLGPRKGTPEAPSDPDPRPSYDPMSVWAWTASNYPLKEQQEK